jgi:hypothetical protein
MHADDAKLYLSIGEDLKKLFPEENNYNHMTGKLIVLLAKEILALQNEAKNHCCYDL